MFRLCLVLTVAHFAFVHGAGGKRQSRIMGFTLGENCDDEIPGFTCKMSGAECKAGPSGEKLCTCRADFEPYLSPLGVTEFDRCAPKSGITLDKANCEVNEDCTKNLPNTMCGPSSASGARFCACSEGNIVNTASGASGCKPYHCVQDGGSDTNAFCDKILKKSSCNTNNGKCECAAGNVLIPGKSCFNLNTDTCAADTDCPQVAQGAMRCLSRGGAQKCVCKPLSNPNVIGTVTTQAGAGICSPPAFGSVCFSADECPSGLQCTKKPNAQPNDKGFCSCAPYQRITKSASGLQTCVAAIGSCCRTMADCGFPPSTQGSTALGCLAYNGRGTCLCPLGSIWDFVLQSCKTTPPNNAC